MTAERKQNQGVQDDVVDPTVVEDLLDRFVGYTNEARLRMLKGVEQQQGWLHGVDSGYVLDKVVDATALFSGYEKVHYTIRQVLVELARYRPEDRLRIVEAAIERVTPIVKRVDNMTKSEKKLARVVRGLPEKTRAIIQVLLDIDSVDSVVSTNFGGAWRPPVDAARISVLRKDPKLRPLLEIHDVAMIVSEENL